MTPVAIAASVFVGVFGGALLGMRLRSILPDPHLNSDTRDVVKLAMGLVATMTALILGLLIASAKGSYDAQRSGVIQMAAKVAYLDRVLALYGPEAADVRSLLRTSVEHEVTSIWPDAKRVRATLAPSSADAQAVYHAVHKLAASSDEQRALKSQAVGLVSELDQMHWLLFEESGTAISAPLLIIVGAWLAAIFTSFGLFAPSNYTVVVALLVASICVAGSVYLILELDQPFDGLIKVSSAPMVSALQRLGN